ncbi:oxidase homolog protein [Seminavis robusta]|uniref:Oxidase homolog protein n=1 Tax=Seminavis robusta TaxID=568900 RepID=A0A9N8E8F8_9STRA|nr:oxidase homolog protein [Seminavis robusta]|eukprot:Sro735_g194840.1 oxidase homolog protein (707) ;mRNA; r:12851-14971
MADSEGIKDSNVNSEEEPDNPVSDKNKQSGRGDSVRISIRAFQSFLHTNGQAAAIQHAFHELDLQKTGRLDRSDLTAFMEEACALVKLELDHKIVQDAVEALLEDVGAEEQNYMTLEQFEELFRRHPDLLACFEEEGSVAIRQSALKAPVGSDKLTAEDFQLEEVENEQVWVHAHTRWKSQKLEYLWFIVYMCANIIAFTYKASVYSNRDDALAVFGTCIIVARGSANCLNLNCALILLPLCRHALTRLRHVPNLSFYFPFDAVLEYHIVIGMAIAVFATSHICAHICDFYRFARADETDIFTLFGNKLGDEIPEGIGARWALMLQQPAGITGLIMTSCLLVAYPMTQIRRKHFNVFWGTHHLLLVMLVALCCHGIGNLLEPFQSVYWVIGPLLLYIIPRVWRETPLSTVEVLDVSLKKGNVIGLKLERPTSWDPLIKAGMYAFLNIPKVSRVEWHPFTLTSAPGDDYIEFHFAKVGDWTGAVHDLLGDLCRNNNNQDEAPDATEAHANPQAIRDLVVRVEGPMGASTQGFKDYPVVVLIGAGIGITPMISVLRELLRDHGKMKRTFFYWTTRDQNSFEWFTQIMDDIFEADPENRIQIRHFLTSMKQDDRDLGAVLFHHATRARHHETNFDLILGQHTHHQVEVGRPNWKEELESVKVASKEINCNDCGIYLCGPERMADSVADVSFDLSKKDPDFHFYFTKETF